MTLLIPRIPIVTILHHLISDKWIIPYLILSLVLDLTNLVFLVKELHD